MNTIKLQRFNGEEEYSTGVAQANWFENKGETFLVIKIKTNKAIKSLEDTESLKALPVVEIFLPFNSADDSKIDGANIEIAKGYDSEKYDFVSSSFYYVEHGEMDNNKVSIKLVEGDKYSLLWTADTTDVNYYDNSKPKTSVVIEAEFILKKI